MMAVCTFLAEVGGIPCLPISLLILASACRALFMQRHRFSLSVRAESSQTPSHLVASSAKKIWLSPTRIGLFFFFFHNFLLFVSKMASVSLVSKRTAFTSAHFMLRARPTGSLALDALAGFA